MANERFARKLFFVDEFQRQLKHLVVHSVFHQFRDVLSGASVNQERSTINWNYMISCASVLARSEEGKHQDAALRIAQFCLVSDSCDETQKAAAAVILDMLTNLAGIKLATEREMLSADYESIIPMPLQLDRIYRGIAYSILIGKEARVEHVNRFQLAVYQGAQAADWLSVSAPTSAGKSFILLRVLLEHLENNPDGIIVYLVPTRALVQQVQVDVTQILVSNGYGYAKVSALPTLPKKDVVIPHIYVLTQERMQWLLNESTTFAPDFLIVDEAQKIAEGSRGILLQQVIEEIVHRSLTTKVLFSSPMTENPELLLEHAPSDRQCLPILSEQVTVNQNLLWASQVKRKPREWTLTLMQGDNAILLGDFQLKTSPNPPSKRLPYVAHCLGDPRGGNLVYVNGPAEAETVAHVLKELQPKELQVDTEIKELIHLVNVVINPTYSLAETLSRRVAFHYGSMPLIIKTEVERLFASGKIKFLVCTSTLIEGVNLPAKSIFIRGPRKGRGVPMGEMDFWNLAGRAGRQGKEFQGNVMCIDPTDEHVWKEPPPRNRMRYEMTRMVDQTLLGEADALINFIEAGTPRNLANEHPHLEYAFTYLLREYLRHEGNCDWLRNKYESAFVDRLCQTLNDVIAKIDVPESSVRGNPGISPLAQQELLNYFREYEGQSEDLLPIAPESEDAYDGYVQLVGVINRYLSGDHPSLTVPHAILIYNWLRGKSLAEIIRQNWYSRQRNPRNTKTLPAVIRETMKDIEDYARFRFAKYASCYVEILKLYLNGIGREDLMEEIPPQLNIWLEFGASQKTQVSLMSLGLSRTTAIELVRFITDDNLEPEDCVRWIKGVDLYTLDLSPIIVSEIRKVTGIEPQSAQSERFD
ncbi:MAG: DEAD/DEAH box helicase [Bacilli bacterium]